MKGAKPTEVRGQLGRFGFSGQKATTKVGKLSGGERARLALALITRDAPHMLILDEPTNHLDVDAREALSQALNAYTGAVVIVSHDRHMLEMTADRLVLVHDGTAQDLTEASTIISASCWRETRSASGQRRQGQQEGGPPSRRGGAGERRGPAQERATPRRRGARLTDSAQRDRARDVRSVGRRTLRSPISR